MRTIGKLTWLVALLAFAACDNAVAPEASIDTTGAADNPAQVEDLAHDSATSPALDELAPQPMPSAALDPSMRLTRIAFGSCLHQDEDHSIFDRIAEFDPQLFMLIGDNVYGDVWSGWQDMPELKTAYAKLARSEAFARFRQSTPLLVTWDDHDYGLNDAGGSIALKEASEQLFLDVWAIPEDDVRRTRPGVYTSYMIGDDGGRVQIILLDTRYFRSDLKPTDERDAPGKERFLPDDDPDKTMLGEAQWAWLADELRKPADVRLIVSSIQVIAQGHGWEAWRTLPKERERLYALIAETGANGVIFLSGDRHSGAIYQETDGVPYPIYELTSSSLNLPLRGWLDDPASFQQERGPKRLSDMYIDENFGVIEFDWEARAVALELRDWDGALIAGVLARLNEMHVGD